jgi:hypothetical protein
MEKDILNINWEITGEERRNKINAGVLIIGPLIVFSFIGYISLWDGGMRLDAGDIIYASVGIMVAFTIAFLFNTFIRYKDRGYYLDENGITITKGNKRKYYAWEEFDSYYNYSEKVKKSLARKSHLRRYDTNIAETASKIDGDVFYLKKQTKNPLLKMCKFFIVVYSDIDNSKDVDIFLARFLEKREMENHTDLGLVFYGFK